MNGYNNNVQVASGNSANRTVVVAKFPGPKPAPPQQPTVVVVPEKPCRKNCCPVLSKGCDLCSNMCGDYYMNPICQSVGITGMLVARPCIQYDEEYMSTADCIGCKKDCGDAGFCPNYGINRPFYNQNQNYYQNGSY